VILFSCIEKEESKKIGDLPPQRHDVLQSYLMNGAAIDVMI
jgi:hypothetical protein